ncbi:STAS-like domain-containing protein [Vreelandella alkaliphila]|uniref:STAS-like domain-containing protein n=1 Tax=Vreelandella alkaliphila TaxID=272774 RepID=UPI003FD8A190
MSKVIIDVVKDFSRRPFGRYMSKFGDRSGEAFREKFLAPNLREKNDVHVILDGYNRYGPSFIDEAFGGLVRESGFDKEYLRDHLSYEHKTLKSVIELIDDRINAAQNDKMKHV